MQVLKTPSPVATPASRGAPNRWPSKTAPVSRARRPGSECSGNGNGLRVGGPQPLVVADVRDGAVDEGEQDAPAQGDAEERAVARQRAQRRLAGDPLRLGVDNGERGPLAEPQ